MTPHDSFETCINAFAGTLGLTLPGRAADDPVVLDIDGTEVSIRPDADGTTIIIVAGVGEMPPDASGVFSAIALQANYAAMGSPAIFLDAETGDLSATASLPLAIADTETLSHTVESLVDMAGEWSRLATAFLDADEEAELSASDEADASPLSGDPDFIRV